MISVPLWKQRDGLNINNFSHQLDDDFEMPNHQLQTLKKDYYSKTSN